jgi:hypothetical protein
MTISKWWGRGLEGLKETANLVSFFSILIVASFLTFDWVLLGAGLVLETGYLCWACLSQKYRMRLESREQSGKLAIDFLDRVLLVVSAAGLVVIVFFGFGKHLLSHPWPNFTHAEGWEAGAIIWTWTFLLYYMVKFHSTENQAVDSFIKVLFSVGSTVLLLLAWFSMKRPTEHVIYVWLIGVCFLVIDSLVVRFHPEPKERELSRASRKWADWPMVIAFGVLFLYLKAHPDTEYPEAFVSGVVACQLLISNSVFVVMEFGLLRLPKVAVRSP